MKRKHFKNVPMCVFPYKIDRFIFTTLIQPVFPSGFKYEKSIIAYGNKIHCLLNQLWAYWEIPLSRQ